MKNILRRINNQLLKIGVIYEPSEPVIMSTVCGYWKQHADEFEQAIKEYEVDHPPGNMPAILNAGCGTNGEPVILPHGHGHHCEGKTCPYYKLSPHDSGKPYHIDSAEESFHKIDWSDAEPGAKEKYRQNLIEAGLMKE